MERDIDRNTPCTTQDGLFTVCDDAFSMDWNVDRLRFRRLPVKTELEPFHPVTAPFWTIIVITYTVQHTTRPTSIALFRIEFVTTL